jgi:hypothetical protein
MRLDLGPKLSLHWGLLGRETRLPEGKREWAHRRWSAVALRGHCIIVAYVCVRVDCGFHERM